MSGKYLQSDVDELLVNTDDPELIAMIRKVVRELDAEETGEVIAPPED